MKHARALRNRLFLERKVPRTHGFYSQYGQDTFIVKEIFHEMPGGFFVEVRAHDGITQSNTYYLEKNLGWKGICIEPNLRIYEKLRKNRKCLCLNTAISDQPGNFRFLKIDGYSEMLSGLIEKYDPRHVERIKKEIGIYGGIAVEITVAVNYSCWVLTEQNSA